MIKHPTLRATLLAVSGSMLLAVQVATTKAEHRVRKTRIGADCKTEQVTCAPLKPNW